MGGIGPWSLIGSRAPVSATLVSKGIVVPEENDKSGSITEIVKAVGELADKVPVYQDAIQPAAKQIGKGLEVVAKAVNAALTRAVCQSPSDIYGSGHSIQGTSWLC